MRFLIYGAGVIGSIFAAKLVGTGNDVTVFARGTRFAEIESRGIALRSVFGGPRERAHVKLLATLESGDIYDYILVPVQRQQVDSILPALAANRSTTIVFMVNTATAYPEWARAVGEERMMTGFPAASGTRVSGPEGTEVKYFIARGLARLFQTATFGEYGGCRSRGSPRLEGLVRTVRRAGIPAVASRNMEAWQRTHVVVVLVFACTLYAVDCDARRLAGSPELVRLLLQALREGFTVLEKTGTPVTPAKLRILKTSETLLVPLLRVLLKTRLADAAMARHVAAAREEMVYLSRELDELIARSGIETPGWDRLKLSLI